MPDNSALPPTTNGARPRPPPPRANPLRPMRPKARTNPLVQRKTGPKTTHPSQAKPAAASSKHKLGSREDLAERRRQNGGWTDPPPPGCTDIPIMTTKKALLDGIRHHMLKLVPTKADSVINPTDQEEFARPVTLHRRDARQPPPARVVAKEEPEPEPKHVDEEERDRLAQAKVEKEAQRAIDQSKMAPVMKDNQPKKQKKQKEDEIKINRAPRTEAAKKASELRYEEALPWHLEDADGKNVWVASYVSALSETTVALMIDGGVFRMVPLEKWYRMTSKPPFQPYSIDEAEAMMERKVVAARWEKRKQQENADKLDLAATRQLFYGRGAMVKTESDTFKAASRHEKLDHDDMDVSGDEFQDDDEQTTMEKQEDEDTKESRDRIRREQRGANNFGEGDEQELEKELKEKLFEELQRQKYGKKTKKKLRKRDNKYLYQSDDSEEKPWTSSSESEDSDEERQREEEEKLQAEKEAKEGKVSQTTEDKDKGKASGTSSKGTNTPKKSKTKSLKRAGSPVSESSGNESVRKKAKVKKTAVGASAAAVAAANSARGSRAGTPVGASGATGKRKVNTGAGSGSDGEATGGEMSDGAGGMKKKIRLVGSNRGTPTVSRAGSPNPPQGKDASPPPNGAGVITPQEILERIPDEGILISNLLALFKGRVGSGPGQMDKRDWIAMVKQTLAYGPDKRLRKKSAAASQ